MNTNRPPVSYTSKDFTLKRRKRGAAPSPATGKTPQIGTEVDPLPLPQDLSEILPSDPKWVDVIATGENPPNRKYATRSELVAAAAVWMLGNGVEPGHILSILTTPDLGISTHVREQANPLAYARRQVRRASEYIASKRGDWPVQTKEGLPVRSHPENIRHALARLAVSARRNLFTSEDEIEGQGFEQRDINDIAEILCSTFVRELHFTADMKAIRRELITLAHENPYHPVIDYLDGLEWDGEERIATWLTDYCGVEDTELNREFGTRVLIAAVRRIKKPGVKFDTMLVLEGPQGTDKSSLVAALAVTDKWFCESLNLRSDDKTKAELLARAWIAECQELDGLNKVTSQELKKFLSERTDTYRKPYDKHAQQYPRHCIIVGTTNETDYLRDLTGNRRIWPVRVGKIDLEGFGAVVDQLWAEATAREADGEAVTLPPHLWDEAGAVQNRRVIDDPYADVLESIFADRHGKVSMDTIKQLLEISSPRMTPQDTRRIKAIMAGIGWDDGTHRLYDLSGRERRPRRGFACGPGDERRTEWRLKRGENGEFYVTDIGSRDNTPPF